MQAAMQAENSGGPVEGIKGVSVLASVIDLVVGIPVDYMHAVLEGVTKWLVHAWFDTKNHGEAFYLGGSIRQIDHLLLQQRPPSEFSRPPRSIKAHLSYWKASELRNWLLYYSLPLFMDFLPSLYLHHYALLVCALHILLQDSLSNAQVDAAEVMLCDFVALLPELYGEKSCTANAHSLTHLTKYVRHWGPLWTHSAFGFESKNGHLKHLFQTFALNPNPVAIVKVFEHSNSSLMKRLGPSCRDVLEEYKEIDFISTFIQEIKCTEEQSVRSNSNLMHSREGSLFSIRKFCV